MKIISLTAENIKKLKVVEIAPSGPLVKITGRNGSGKSSVLDSIWWALGGTKEIQGQPIRQGQTTARIRLDLGEIKVERKFTDKGSSLIVENADGARFPSPQVMLDKLVGALSFDVLAYTRLKLKDQFDELRRVAELDLDIDALDAASKADFDTRTNINRDAKARRAQAEAIIVPAGLPSEPIDEAGLIDQMQSAAAHNTEIETRKQRRSEAQAKADMMASQINHQLERAADLRRQADAIENHALAQREDLYALREKIDTAEPLPEPVDIADLRTRLGQAQATNKQIVEAKRRAAIITEAKVMEEKSADLTKAIDDRTKQKQDSIARAKLPVEGLGFGDGVVTFKGIPLDQASSAEQIRVSMGIAMATNPRLRVIRIQDGSLLDDDSLAEIARMAGDQDYQVWIEQVDTTGKIGIVMEDGEVRQMMGAAE